MSIINILSTDLANKIAAGEVIERPASVIKELVENSIDAGAKNITVEIKNGGITYMRVADDGCGMSKDDVSIAFLRHATSKIKTHADLNAIYTLGFRGEALSSVASVAHIDCFTKQRSDETGTYIHIEDAVITDSSSAGVPNGTTITVERLFYNTPARMKFLKKDSTEAGHISALMERFVLSNPDISFKFINNGKEMLFSPGDNNLLNTIYVIYGKDYANSMIAVNYEFPPFTVSGYAGKADISRPNRNMQNFFINKRTVKSALLTKAAEEAYKNQLMSGKFPAFILNMTINPSAIDINVHPTKTEVKFADERTAYEAVYFAVKNALHSISPYIETTENTKSYIMNNETVSYAQTTISAQDDHKTSEPDASFVQKAKPVNCEPNKSPDLNSGIKPLDKPNQDSADINTAFKYKTYDEKEAEKATEGTAFTDGEQSSTVFRMRENENKLIGYKLVTPAKPVLTDAQTSQSEDNLPELSALPNEKAKSILDMPYKYIGQIFSTYILIEIQDSLILIDQHAAHERTLFETLKTDYLTSSISTQLLLSPIIVTMTQNEYSVFCENTDFFAKLGFELDSFGNTDIIVRSAPMNVNLDELPSLILELVTMLEDNKQEPIPQKAERMLYTIACKSAIKAGKLLTLKEIDSLISSVTDLNTINTCPHGRPIVLSVSKHDLEKLFKRIV